MLRRTLYPRRWLSFLSFALAVGSVEHEHIYIHTSVPEQLCYMCEPGTEWVKECSIDRNKNPGQSTCLNCSENTFSWWNDKRCWDKGGCGENEVDLYQGQRDHPSKCVCKDGYIRVEGRCVAGVARSTCNKEVEKAKLDTSNCPPCTTAPVTSCTPCLTEETVISTTSNLSATDGERTDVILIVVIAVGITIFICIPLGIFIDRKIIPCLCRRKSKTKKKKVKGSANGEEAQQNESGNATNPKLPLLNGSGSPALHTVDGKEAETMDLGTEIEMEMLQPIKEDRTDEGNLERTENTTNPKYHTRPGEAPVLVPIRDEQDHEDIDQPRSHDNNQPSIATVGIPGSSASGITGSPLQSVATSETGAGALPIGSPSQTFMRGEGTGQPISITIINHMDHSKSTNANNLVDHGSSLHSHNEGTNYYAASNT